MTAAAAGVTGAELDLGKSAFRSASTWAGGLDAVRAGGRFEQPMPAGSVAVTEL